MKRRLQVDGLWCVTVLMVLMGSMSLGCGGGSSGVGESEVQDLSAIKVYAAKALATAEFETPDVDGGRVKIPTPKGWKVGDRQNNVLMRFYTDDSSGLPRIVATAEPSPSLEFDTVNADNLGVLAEYVQGDLDQKAEKSGKATYREPCRLLQLGDNFWVRYVAAGKWKGHNVDRVLLKTVVDKRLYTLELNVMAGQIRDFQKGAYAIAGRMVFTKAGGASAAPAAADPAAPAPPAADAKPADAKPVEQAEQK